MIKQLEKLKGHREITGVTLFVISTFLQRGLALITTPIFTRLLTSYDYGIVSTYNTWSGIFSIIFTLSIAANAFNTGLIKFKDDRDRYVSNMLGITAFMVFVGFCLTYVFRVPIENASKLSFKFFIILFINLYVDVIYGFWGLCAKFDGQYVKIVIANLGLSFLSIVITIWSLTYISYDAAFVKIVSGSVVNMVFAGILTIKYLKNSMSFFRWKYWKYALTFCVPLIPHYMSNHLLNQSDRLMITSMCGAEKTGIYTIAYKIPEIMNIFWSCISSVYIPWLYKRLDVDDNKEIAKVNNIIMVGISAVTFGIVLVGPEIITILAPAEYAEGKYLIPALVTGYYGLFICLMCSHIELFYKKNYFITVITLTAASVNIALNFLLIPKYGYMAAAYTTFVGYTIMLILHAMNIKRLKFDRFINIKLQIGLFAITATISMGMLMIYDHIVIRYGLLAVIAFLCLSRYNQILAFIKKLKEK